MGTNGGSLRMSFVSLKEYASCRYLLNLNKCNILFIFTGNPSEKSLKRPATAGSQFKVTISLHILTTSIKTHSQNTLQVPSRFCITKKSSTGKQVLSFWYFGWVFVWLNYLYVHVCYMQISVTELMKNLLSKNPNYIRCVKVCLFSWLYTVYKIMSSWTGI